MQRHYLSFQKARGSSFLSAHWVSASTRRALETAAQDSQLIIILRLTSLHETNKQKPHIKSSAHLATVTVGCSIPMRNTDLNQLAEEMGFLASSPSPREGMAGTHAGTEAGTIVRTTCGLAPPMACSVCVCNPGPPPGCGLTTTVGWVLSREKPHRHA